MRLNGFDYKSPFFYMVTVKKLRGARPFCEIRRDIEDADAAKPGDFIIANELTYAFIDTIRRFNEKWFCIEPIKTFSIMPDHIHLLIKIRDIEKRLSLPKIVWQLTKSLEEAYFALYPPGGAGGGKTDTAATPSNCAADRSDGANPDRAADRSNGANPNGAADRSNGANPNCVADRSNGVAELSNSFAAGGSARPHCFEENWHDWIVKKQGQLKSFSRYIVENPYRAWLRGAHPEYFGRVTRVSFIGREWFAYGNLALLDSPVLRGFKGHRATVEGSAEWNAMIEKAARIGPGGAGVSTFMSPLEKAVGNAIAKAGGGLIVLSPEGFGARWHPTREKERFCAAGRMLFISLYGAETRQPTRKELYERCHEMVDLAANELAR